MLRTRSKIPFASKQEACNILLIFVWYKKFKSFIMSQEGHLKPHRERWRLACEINDFARNEVGIEITRALS